MVRKLFIVSLPASVVALLAIEVLLRIIGYVPYYLNEEALVPSPNSAAVYQLKPGFHGLYGGVPIAINSLGFRGNELAQNLPPGTRRILLLGDSIVFSQGVQEGRTLADQVSARLRARTSAPVEVVDLGVPGWNSCQELAFFRDRGIPLKPEAAVLIYVDNDVYPPAASILGNNVITADIRPGWAGTFMAWWRKHSFAYNFVWSHWQTVKNRGLTIEQYRRLLARNFDDANPAWQASRGCVAQIAALAKANSIRLIVLPFPELSGLRQKVYPFQDYIQKICRVARDVGAECLDVTSALQTPGLRLWVSSVERHPSAEVHAKMAERISDVLLRGDSGLQKKQP